MAAVKTLKPPFVWTGKELVEDHRYVQWSAPQLRDMKNGTYDWANHTERPNR